MIIALLLITGQIRATSLQINPASISIGISGFFLRLLEGINFKPGNIAGFNSSNTAALPLLTGDATIKTNPVRACPTGNNISGNEIIFPLISKHITSIHLSLMLSILPVKTVRVITAMGERTASNKTISTVITNKTISTVITKRDT